MNATLHAPGQNRTGAGTGEGFPVRLRRMRRRHGMSHEVLAGLCSLHVNAIERYEAGKTMPSTQSLCRLADCFQVSTDYLLCRTDDPRTL